MQSFFWRQSFYTDVQPYLKEPENTDHFRIRFGHRHVSCGRGIGTHGVEEPEIITLYANALETQYDMMLSPYLRGENDPVVLPDKPIYVYVCDTLELTSSGSPFAYVDTQEPFICLPSRFRDTTRELAYQYAVIAAVHEATHIFTHTWRSQARQRAALRDGVTLSKDLHRDDWKWFDEATALYVETITYPESLRILPYCLEWNDAPELPLDDPIYYYRGMLFARFLERAEVGFVYRVWNEADPVETPVQTIDRLLQQTKGVQFSAPGDSDVDVFFAYCLDAYFLAEHPPDVPEHLVFQRYRGRMITETFCLEETPRGECQDGLLHLSCRYYRFRPAGKPGQLEVSVRSDGAQGPMPPQGGHCAFAWRHDTRGCAADASAHRC